MTKTTDTVTFKTIRTEAGVAYSLDDWLIRGKVTPDSRHRSEYGIPLRARNIVVALLRSAAGREALEVYTDAVTKEAVVTAAVQKLAARGWFKPSRCADKETSADMAAVRRALKGAGELYCTGCGRIGQIDRVVGAPPAEDTPDTTELTTPEESTKPYPTTYLNAGLDAVYITVRVGEAQCQRAIPREIVLNVEAPEQRIGGIVLKQIKAVDSINAAAKEKP